MKHVAIIGAGIIGVTSAWVLRQQGHKVTIFDKNRYPAMETSFLLMVASYLQAMLRYGQILARLRKA